MGVNRTVIIRAAFPASECMPDTTAIKASELIFNPRMHEALRIFRTYWFEPSSLRGMAKNNCCKLVVRESWVGVIFTLFCLENSTLTKNSHEK